MNEPTDDGFIADRHVIGAVDMGPPPIPRIGDQYTFNGRILMITATEWDWEDQTLTVVMKPDLSDSP